MILPIVTISDVNASVLTAPTAKAVNPEYTREVVTNLFDTVKGKGIGLASPQVGLSLRIFVVSYGRWKQAFVNPHIIRVSENETSEMEGCLSIPGVQVKVSRPKMIWIDYFDETGKEFRNQKFRKMEARIIQHEYDHLHGRLITDYNN